MNVAIETDAPRDLRHLGSNGSGVMKNMVMAFLAVALAGVIAYYFLALRMPKLIDSEYQAVLLDNGAAYFGRIVQTTGDDVVLREVYYVQSRTNPETKQVSNILIKRGGEWHGPDRMVINRQHLVFIEPVAPASMVAKLIAETKHQ